MARIPDARRATRVRVAPDGSWLGYVTDLTGTPRLRRVPMAGGMPTRLTAYPRVLAFSQRHMGGPNN